MRCQLEFGSRSHLIAKLSTIRQLTSKISCKLSIMDNNRETIVLRYFWTTQKAEYDQLIKLRGQTNFRLPKVDCQFDSMELIVKIL